VHAGTIDGHIDTCGTPHASSVDVATSPLACIDAQVDSLDELTSLVHVVDGAADFPLPLNLDFQSRSLGTEEAVEVRISNFGPETQYWLAMHHGRPYVVEIHSAQQFADLWAEASPLRAFISSFRFLDSLMNTQGDPRLVPFEN
jgi:hypothetical protein